MDQLKQPENLILRLMKKRIVMLRILFFLGWISLSTNIFSQSQIKIYDFALSQYAKGNYLIAVKEFERCLFFEEKVKSELLRNLADSYSKLGEYEKASEYYEKAFHLEATD